MRSCLAPLAALVAVACSGPGAQRATGLATSDTPPRPHARTDAAAGEAGLAHERPAERPGLGTVYAETVESRARPVPFVRAAAHPLAEVALHYNDARGVAAQAAHRGASLSPLYHRPAAADLVVSLARPDGETLAGFAAADRTYVIGEDGARYVIVIENRTAARFEVVASVDGRDVIDGEPAGFDRRGYVVPAHGRLVIDGFRTDLDTAAAFRFGRVASSYAARRGDDRAVGVIGVALFAEAGWADASEPAGWTGRELERRESADPFPRRFAAPPAP
jgi:hypothetical protein